MCGGVGVVGGQRFSGVGVGEGLPGSGWRRRRRRREFVNTTRAAAARHSGIYVPAAALQPAERRDSSYPTLFFKIISLLYLLDNIHKRSNFSIGNIKFLQNLSRRQIVPSLPLACARLPTPMTGALGLGHGFIVNGDNTAQSLVNIEYYLTTDRRL